jgi:ribonuclease HI
LWGIYRNNKAEFLGAFAYNLGNTNALVAELHGAMFAIELAYKRGWNHIWLETNSMLVTLAFKSRTINCSLASQKHGGKIACT